MHIENKLKLVYTDVPFVKESWGRSNNFYQKRPFFILKQNRIIKKFQKFTCKPQLAYLVCIFECMTSRTWRKSSKLLNLINSGKIIKNTIKLYRKSFLHKTNKKYKEKQGWNILYIRRYDVCYAKFITLRNPNRHLPAQS